MPDEPGRDTLDIGGDSGFDVIFTGVIDGINIALGTIVTVINDIIGFLGVIVDFLKQLWDKILKPLFEKLEKLFERLHRIYNRIIKPILDAIERQRRFIRRIYEIYFRPVLDLLQAMRAFLAITKLNNTALGRALDQRLSHLEAKVAAPITAALKTINDQARLINIILAPDLLFQDVTHLRSIVKSMGHIADAFYNMSRVRSVPARDFVLGTVLPVPTPAEERSAFQQLLTNASGPLADTYSRDKTSFRQILAS